MFESTLIVWKDLGSSPIYAINTVDYLNINIMHDHVVW